MMSHDRTIVSLLGVLHFVQYIVIKWQGENINRYGLFLPHSKRAKLSRQDAAATRAYHAV